jgi:8-oxo-dGTP pyrophosphatase MutT (NUDIX family)
VTEAPQGAAVLVWREGANGDREWLILHRATNGAAYEGDWAWTPPSGLREHGEDAAACARRELREEVGLELAVERVEGGSPDWPVFLAEAPRGVAVALSFEHDRYEWVTADEAERRCLPPRVGSAFRTLA